MISKCPHCSKEGTSDTFNTSLIFITRIQWLRERVWFPALHKPPLLPTEQWYSEWAGRQPIKKLLKGSKTHTWHCYYTWRLSASWAVNPNRNKKMTTHLTWYSTPTRYSKWHDCLGSNWSRSRGRISHSWKFPTSSFGSARVHLRLQMVTCWICSNPKSQWM